MPNATKLILDVRAVEQMKRSIWRDEARRAGVWERDIERTVFWRWRLIRDGLLQEHRGTEMVNDAIRPHPPSRRTRR